MSLGSFICGVQGMFLVSLMIIFFTKHVFEIFWVGRHLLMSLNMNFVLY